MPNNNLNTIPIQQFVQQVKSADLGQQKEIRLDIKTAKSLVYCLTEVLAKLNQDYDQLLADLKNSDTSVVQVQLDGGGFSNKTK